MQMRNATLVAACAVVALAGCAGTAQKEVSDQQRHVGKVVRVDIAHLPATYSESQREKLASIHAALGPAAPDLLGKQGHPVYRVQPAGGVELVVSSRDEFSVGECVEVRYPAATTGRRHFSLGEAEIAKASGC
jgi:hypothetical protein